MVYKPKRKAAPKPKPPSKKKPATKRKAASSKKRVSLFDKARPRIEGHAAGGSISAFIAPHNIMPPYMKAIYRATNKCYWSQSVARSYNSTQGQQGVGAFPIITGGSDTFRNAMILAAAAQTTPWSNTQRVMFVKTTTTFLLRNDNNNEMVLDLYDIVSRRDQVVDDPVNTPIFDWQNGMSDAGQTAFVSLNLGATPFMSPLLYYV